MCSFHCVTLRSRPPSCQGHSRAREGPLQAGRMVALKRQLTSSTEERRTEEAFVPLMTKTRASILSAIGPSLRQTDKRSRQKYKIEIN